MNTNQQKPPVSASPWPFGIGVIVFFVVALVLTFYVAPSGPVVVAMFLFLAVWLGARTSVPRLGITINLALTLVLALLILYVGGFHIQIISYTSVGLLTGLLAQHILENNLRIRHK